MAPIIKTPAEIIYKVVVRNLLLSSLLLFVTRHRFGKIWIVLNRDIELISNTFFNVFLVFAQLFNLRGLTSVLMKRVFRIFKTLFFEQNKKLLLKNILKIFLLLYSIN